MELETKYGTLTAAGFDIGHVQVKHYAYGAYDFDIDVKLWRGRKAGKDVYFVLAYNYSKGERLDLEICGDLAEAQETFKSMTDSLDATLFEAITEAATVKTTVRVEYDDAPAHNG